jgi:AcrR family transcriptional regulator
VSKDATLASLLPDSLAGELDRWQQRKSRETRNLVLEAAIDCLAEGGYPGCSLQLVADRAGISRGAMLHHYSSKLELMAAVIEYAFYKRMQDFLRRIRALSDDARTERLDGVYSSYASCGTPAYRAYLALHLASRSDPELRQIFIDRARRFGQVWRDEAATVFPEWRDHPALDAMNDFVCMAVEGLALNADIWDDPQRVETMLAFIAHATHEVRADRLALRREGA